MVDRTDELIRVSEIFAPEGSNCRSNESVNAEKSKISLYVQLAGRVSKCLDDNAVLVQAIEKL